MNKNLVKQFNFWRILGIVALVCTLLLTVVLCVESLKPGDKSEATSGSVSTSIKDSSTVHDNDRTYPLTGIRCGQINMSAPVGTKKELTFTYTPTRATDKRLTFSSDNPDIVSVDENGVLCFNSFGNTSITATAVANPSVATTFNVLCTGADVDDISDLHLSYFSSTDNCTQMKVGSYSYIYLRNAKGEIVSVDTLSMRSQNPDVLIVDMYLHIVALKQGSATVTFTHKKTGQTKNIQVEVIEGTAPPTEFKLKEEVIYLHKNQTFEVRSNVIEKDPNNRFASYSCDNPSLFSQNCYEYTAIKVGEATFTVTPYVENGVPTTFRVIVTEPTPTNLTIIGNDRIVRDANYTYTAFNGERECECIKWSVIKGDAQFTDDGNLVANKLGNVVIRATSTLDENVYADLTVRVSLFERFATFVRKVIGHFSAFVVLGIGLAVSTFLLCGRLRKFSALFSALGGFLVASITEILQLPIFTANRGPSFDDVLLDTAGALCGVGLAALIVWVVLGAIKLRSPQKHAETKFCINKLSFKTAFCSKKTIATLFCVVDTSTTTTIASQELSTTDECLTTTVECPTVPDGAVTLSNVQSTIPTDQTTIPDITSTPDDQSATIPEPTDE